ATHRIFIKEFADGFGRAIFLFYKAMPFVKLVMLAWGAVLAACAGYEIALMIASVPRLLRRKPAAPAEPRTRFLVVIPAHDEAALIAQTVQSVQTSDYPVALRNIVVVADNCADETAAEA